ncbi:MAG: serine hydrolase [Bacteroidota bacterium]
MRFLLKYLVSIFALFLLQSSVSQPIIEDIDKYIIKARQDWEIPGMAVAIVKDGEIVLSRGYGVLKSGNPERVDGNTLFAIASNTKAFISASLSLLVDQGKLSWHDKVHEILPSFELFDPYVTAHTNVEDLLCHRVGLGTYSGDLIWYKSNLTSEEVIGKIKIVPQAFEFRDGYGYSNLMFIVAGEVIKRISGQNWDEFIDSAFFNPLNMKRTVTSTESLKGLQNVATPHKPYASGNQIIDWVNWDNMGAAGGIISSSNDMAQWIKLQLNEGNLGDNELIPLQQQRKMWTIHNSRELTNRDRDLIPGRSYKGYGLGWNIDDYRGKKVISHGGGYDGMYSKVMMVPDEELGIVILTNSMKSIRDPLCYYIIDRYLGAEYRDWSSEMLRYQGQGTPGKTEILRDARVKKTKPTHELNHYGGTYYSEMHGNISIKPMKEGFRLEFGDAPHLNATLTHWHYDTWEINWDEPHAWFGFGLVQFKIDTDLSVIGLHFDVPNYDIFFDEVDLVKIDRP